ncbi:MAG: glucose-6-phosphate isomerase [Gemmatimonadales bacterium]|nr:glucose-6-phosphate isomerase [Gemmatimonadales bacterium]
MIEAGGIRLDVSDTRDFLTEEELQGYSPRVEKAAAELEDGKSPGSDFLGWLDLPDRITETEFATIEKSAARARDDSEICVVIGIGGSYLGARAILDALPDSGTNENPEILFAGTGLCAATLDGVLNRLAGKDFRVCVISKSGTTLEPALAFRILRSMLIERYGAAAAARRITAITDAEKGALRQLAIEEGYETFIIPDNVGGRFSVLTPVGLVPLAMAGIDIRALVAGAGSMRAACRATDLFVNPAHLYAATRIGLYEKGFTTEVMSTFHGGLQTIQEWWKQLFGESEGKGGQGIFPASTVFTTDLHSLGQYIQDGRRNLQETFLCVRDSGRNLTVPAEGEGGNNLDGLDYLVGRNLDDINWKAFEGTRKAHLAGGVPCTAFELESITPENVGGLIYLFEKAVGIGGRLLKVNPFDQPGVETYKKEMFRLLGKP